MIWRSIKLSQVVSIQMGQSPVSEYYNSDGIGLPFFQGKADFTERFPQVKKWCSQPIRIAKEGDILLSVRAPVGPTNIAPCECCIGRGLAGLRAIDSLMLQQYLWYFLKIAEPTLSSKGQGAIFSAVSRSDIGSLSIPLPPLSEQRRIVDILDKAYAIRKMRAEADEKMQRFLPALYYQSQRRNHQLPIVPLGSLSAPEKGSIRIGPFGSQLKKEDLSDSGVHVVGIENVLKEQFDGLGLRYISESKYSTLKAFTVLPDDVLITMMGTIGEVAVVPSGISPSIMDSHLVRFRADHNKCLPEYIALVIKNDAKVRQSIEGKAHGAIMKGLNSKIIKSIPVSLPPIHSQKKIVEAYRHLQKSVHQAQQVKQRIETLYSVLLHRAFSGELTARWREAHMKELLHEMETQKKEMGKVTREIDLTTIVTRDNNLPLLQKKAVLLSYIILRSSNAKHQMARVKLAKQYYFVNQLLHNPLNETFSTRAAGPLDDDLYPALEIAQENKWIVIEPLKGKEKPLTAGVCIADTEIMATEIIGRSKAIVDAFLLTTQDWGWETFERWATVHSAVKSLFRANIAISVENVISYIDSIPEWKAKLTRDEFVPNNIMKTISGLKRFGFI